MERMHVEVQGRVVDVRVEELTNQDRFRRALFERHHIVFSRLTPPEWDAYKVRILNGDNQHA